MNKTERKFILAHNLLAAACIFVLFASCTTKPEDAIIGKWREKGHTEIIEFLKDGTVNVDYKGTTMYGGSYKFVEKDQIKLELGGLYALVGPIVAKVSISEEELTLTVPNGNVLKYEKVE
ncbi:MAG: hypothetical protein ABIJ37_08580 [Pseudomonadota bacterium]